MRLQDEFEVAAPMETTWTLLNDVPRVVPCMPGAELTEVVGDNRWKAVLSVKLGPIALKFRADVVREEADPVTRVVVLTAKAREARGRGSAQARIESRLVATEAGTRAVLTTDLKLQGPVAQYGRGMVSDVAGQLTRQFAECVAERVTADRPSAGAVGATPSRPVGGIRVLVRAVWHRLARIVRRDARRRP